MRSKRKVSQKIPHDKPVIFAQQLLLRPGLRLSLEGIHAVARLCKRGLTMCVLHEQTHSNH